MGFAQQTASDSIYNKLDVFLAEPSTQNSMILEKYIESISGHQKEVQLAKTVAYCNMGYTASKIGALQSAIDFYEKAKQIYFSENLSRYDIIEYCLKPLGNLYTKTQALSEAENTIKHYLVLAQETKQLKQEISAILNLSVIYQNRGEFNRAIRLLQRGLKKAPNDNRLRLNLATNYFSLKNIEEAKTLVQNILESSQNNPAGYQLLAQIYLSEKKYDQAISALKTALQDANKSSQTNSRELAKLHLALAEIYFADKKVQPTILELQKVYRQLLPTYKPSQKWPKTIQIYAETTLMDALDLHATALAKMGNSKKAIETFEIAFTVNDYLFTELYAQDSKLLVQQNVKKRAENILDLIYQQYKTTKDTHWLEKAIQIDNRVKGQVAFDAVKLQQKLSSTSRKLANEYQKLQEELILINNKISMQTASPNPNYKKLVALQKSYSSLLTRQRMLYDSIQKETPTAINTEPISLEALQSKAEKTGKTLVSYFLGKKSIYQIIISKKHTTFRKLNDSKKEYSSFLTAIREYNKFFNDPSTINNDISAFTKASHSLYNQLQLPQADAFVIIPDGLLTFVPFQTLLTKSTQTNQYKAMPFLLFDSSVSYAVSLRKYLNNTGSFKKEQSVLGVFPVFKNTEQELSYSVKEAKAIDQLFPTKLLMESEATANAFIDQESSYSILHISTHAIGGAFYSEPSIQFIDRALNLEELYGLQFSQQLVILSACGTGVGKVIKGEGALSLARGFQYAGAPNVLFSLWQVNDKSTAELMEFYYENLKKTRSRDGSLHKASLDYLNSDAIGNAQKSPYYWGAFVYYGATDTVQKPSETYWYLWAIGGVLLLGLFVWRLKRRKTHSEEE